MDGWKIGRMGVGEKSDERINEMDVLLDGGMVEGVNE